MLDKPIPSSPDRIRWLSDLVRLEIVLWERINDRLHKEHNLSLAYFEVLNFIDQTSTRSLRVGDLARLLQVTVGGTSKLVDRIERDGLIQRENDPGNRRASLIVLTEAGGNAVIAASKTYEAEMAAILESVLSNAEQHQMHEFITRLLNTTKNNNSKTDI